MPQKNYKGKLGNKIFFLMALIGVVPLVVAAGLTEYVVTNSHRDDVAKLESAVLLQKGIEIENFINGSILSQTRVLVPFTQSINVATSAQAFVLKQTFVALPFLASESFVNLSGMETARADRTHLDGYPASALQDMSGTTAFQQAKQGHSYIGPVSYDSNNTPMVTFASAVQSDTGEIIGVVIGSAYLSNIQSIVASGQIGNTGYLYLVDQDGNMIAGGMGFAGKSGSSITASLSIVKKVLAGETLTTPETQMRYVSAEGEPVIGAAIPLTDHGAWGLVAEWPAKEADAVVSALLVRDVIVLVGVLLAVIILSILATLFITRPIKKLEKGTAHVAEGKFDEGVSIETGDELEELGESFNKMVMGLKELEQLKDEIVFIAAHELRTPVAAMKGYLTLILEGTTGDITEGTRDYITKVIASNQRLIQLVNDLLEVARSQAGRLTIKVAPLALAAPIGSVLDELKALADEKGTKMVYEPPANLPNVLGDGDRIKEVVINLVGNAIKYMGGAGTITITNEAKGDEVITHIADTGLGMSKEAQGKLFEKFYRVQTDKTKDITGTGLGLFIVKQIVEKMNGRIWVESEEGKGSVFSFSLPIAK